MDECGEERMWVVKLWDCLDENLAIDHVESSMTLGPVHMMGSPKTQVPTHVSKSQRGGEVPTFEPEEIIIHIMVDCHQYWFLIILCETINSVGHVLTSGSRFFLDPTLNTSPTHL